MTGVAPIIRTLEHARPAVASSIHAVMQAAYVIEADLLGVRDFIPLRRTVERIATAANAFRGVLINGRLAAVIELEAASGQVNIAALVVRPEYFRTGLGTALVREAVRRAPTRTFTVSTGTANEPALRLYRREGFHDDRRWTTEDGIPMMTLVRRPSD